MDQIWPHDGPPKIEVTGEATGADWTRVLMRLALMLTRDEVRNGRTGVFLPDGVRSS